MGRLQEKRVAECAERTQTELNATFCGFMPSATPINAAGLFEHYS